jgi:hypothetical protein
MKVNTATNNIESSGMNLEVDFTIDMNSKAFNVLSDQMYSEVIPTVVRELSSNAFDSHKESGKSDVPFEVRSPTGFDPYFGVKDFGTGLRYYNYNAKIRNDADEDIEGAVTSTIFINGDVRKEIEGITLLILNEVDSINISNHSILYDRTKDQTCIRLNGEHYGNDVSVEFDDTLVLYTTYFRSTKEKTNDYIGGYGLGSKTPFAYTDNFMVTNRFNGTLRSYSIYKNAEGKPCINLMGSMPTDESNGLEVKIAVDPDDYVSFKEAIENQLKFFVPQPTVLNDVVQMPKIIHQGTHFLLMDTDKYDAGRWNVKAAASVGFNSYEVKYIQSKLFSTKLALRFNIGEVMVTASREDLKYDDATIAIIEQREQDAIEEYTAYVLDTIDVTNMEDYQRAAYLNANNEVLDLSTKVVRDLVGNPHYKYTKKNISIPITGWTDHTSLSLDAIKDDQGNVTCINLNKFGCRTVRQMIMLKWGYNQKFEVCQNETIAPNTPVYFFVKDNPYSYKKKINYWLDTNGNGATLGNSQVYIIEQPKGTALDTLKSMVTHIGTFVNIGDIELPKTISTTPSTYGQTPTARMYVKGTNRFDFPKYWTGVYTPLTKIDRDAYVVQTHNGNIVEDDQKYMNFLETYMESDLPFDPDTVILMLSVKRYEKAMGYGFKSLADLVDDLMEELTIPMTAVNGIPLDDLFYNSINDLNILGLFTRAGPEQMERLDKTSEVAQMLRIKNIISKRYVNRDSNRIYERLMGYLPEDKIPETSETVTKAVDKIKKMCENISESFILLSDVRSYEMRDKTKTDALIEYINLLNTGALT